MIGSLSGTVASRRGSAVIIDVGGVGYLVHASSVTINAMGDVGSQAFVFVETQVRDDAITLFGFSDDDERDTFMLLVTVQGVGPKVALALLSAFPNGGLLAAIAVSDHVSLCRADHVGPRLAARIVTDLAEKAAKLQAVFGGISPVTGYPSDLPGTESLDIRSVRATFERLGYGRSEIQSMVSAAIEAVGTTAGIQALVSAGLRSMKRV